MSETISTVEPGMGTVEPTPVTVEPTSVTGGSTEVTDKLWTGDDEEMRIELGFAKESGEARFMHGQRRINGRLFQAVETILECLINEGNLSPTSVATLQKVQASIAKIPGEDPPKCVVDPKA
ncbi:MAG: hypothetical protein QOE77_2234 [Blastocatellia bacterium]|jgi:hypothetical protein|nr:hypothetical protein [Blastocatellia bacterium]